MNYDKIYRSIIDKALNENRVKSKLSYYERHHIIPSCVGGTNDKNNLVLLTAKEHFICHKLLCEIYDSPKLKYAYWAMCKQTGGDMKRNYRVSSKTYENAKKEAMEFLSERMKNLSDEERGFHKGSKHSDETKANWSIVRKGKYVGEDNNFFGKIHTEESRNKMSKTRKDRGIIPHNVGKIQEKTHQCSICQVFFSKGGLTQHLQHKHK